MLMSPPLGVMWNHTTKTFFRLCFWLPHKNLCDHFHGDWRISPYLHSISIRKSNTAPIISEFLALPQKEDRRTLYWKEMMWKNLTVFYITFNCLYEELWEICKVGCCVQHDARERNLTPKRKSCLSSWRLLLGLIAGVGVCQVKL